MKNILTLGVSLVAVIGAIGCFGFERKSTVTGPSASGLSALMGNWTSSNIIPSASSCTDFKWNVTEQTANSARGAFSATCSNNALKLSGTAEGTLSGSLVNWKAAGKATAGDLVSCDISLEGTAELGVDSIRVPYSGQTCLGRVSGVEVLRKN
jgi:hypothetical protein